MIESELKVYAGAAIFVLPSYIIAVLVVWGCVYLKTKYVKRPLSTGASLIISTIGGLILWPSIALLFVPNMTSFIVLAWMTLFMYVLFAPVSTILGGLLLGVYLFKTRKYPVWIWYLLVVAVILLQLIYLSNVDLDASSGPRRS